MDKRHEVAEFYNRLTQAAQPERIICAATAVMINPIMRVNGSVACSFTSARLIWKDSSMQAKFINKAMKIQSMVAIIPFIRANEIDAVIVPAPAINGIASGAIETSG